MTQQVRYRPNKYQSRSWPSRVTAVSGSHIRESPLLKAKGIQYVTISMLGTTTNVEPETYRRQDSVFVCVRETAFTVWSAASVSESELQPTENISDVLPNQQSHQVLYRTTCCVGCGNLSDYPLQYCTLIALVFGRGALAKPSGSFPLQYRSLIA